MAYNAGGSTGNRILIESQTVSGAASLIFNTGISGYDYYEIEFFNFLNATTGQQLFLRMAVDGGTNWTASSYASISSFGIPTGVGAGVTNTAIFITNPEVNTTATRTANGYIKLYNLASTSVWKQALIETGYNHAAGIATCTNHGDYQSTSAVNALQLIYASGNIATGTANLYGIQN